MTVPPEKHAISFRKSAIERGRTMRPMLRSLPVLTFVVATSLLLDRTVFAQDADPAAVAKADAAQKATDEALAKRKAAEGVVAEAQTKVKVAAQGLAKAKADE